MSEQQQRGPHIPKGKYKARAKRGQWGLGTAGNGTPQVAVRFDLVAFEAGITWYGFFTDKAMETTLKALDACGWKGVDIKELDREDCGLDANEVELVVEEERGQDGVVRSKVRWVNSGGGVALKNRMQGNDLDSFAAQMRKRIMAKDPARARAAASAAPAKPPAPRAPPAAPPPREPGSDDDIPF
jgi:hypothetical protein